MTARPYPARRSEAVLTTPEAAALLKLSPRKVQLMVRDGTLRTVEGVGRNFRIVAADVYALAGTTVPGHEALSDTRERDDLLRELSDWLLDGHRLYERLKGL